MESKKLYGASTQMTPAVYKDFYKTYYNEKLKVFKIVAEIVGLIAIFGAFYILANGYGILWGAIALWIGAFLLFYPRMIYRKPYKNAKDNSQTTADNNEIPGASAPGIIIIRFSQSSPAPGVPGGNALLCSGRLRSRQ